MTVALFPSCMTDRIFPEQGESIVTTLQALGVNVLFPDGLHCCGLVANNSGDETAAIPDGEADHQRARPSAGRSDRVGQRFVVATLAQD
ncbi:MAG: (Fe-S)-binding protein [Thermomicrobiales bacterium]